MTPPRTATSPRRPAPAPERPRHLEVVQGTSVPGRRPPLLVVLFLVLATGVSLFGLVAANVLLGQAGFRVAELERRVSEQRLAVEELELSVARLRAPSRIAARAQQIGLVPATDVRVLVSSPDRGPSSSRGGR